MADAGRAVDHDAELADLLFADWRVDVAVLRARVPAALPLDLYDGEAWLGVVPFRMTGVAPRGVLPVSLVSTFRS